MSPHAPLPRIAFLAILLLAAVLRFTHLDTQSFWSDEGNSIAMVGRTIPDILSRSADDISPPLYYLALDAWGGLVGRSEFAIRSFSALLGVLAVALTALLGRRIGGWPVALVAAFASAVSPFAIHYAQEARMYGPIAALVLLPWYALARLQRQPDHPGWLVTYLFGAVALLYTQYFTAAALAGINLAWLWHGVRRGDFRPTPRRWLGSQLLVALLFLPWLLIALPSILGWPATSEPLSVEFLLREMARIFSIGLENEGMGTLATVGVALLLALGLSRALPALWRREGFLDAAPLWILLVPPLLMLLLSLDRPFWNPKFLTIALAGFHLLLGQGSARLAEGVRRLSTPRPVAWLAPAAVMLFLLAIVQPTLTNLYTNPDYWRDDYRTVAQIVAARAGDQDAVILDGAGQAEIWDYYDQSGLPTYPMPPSRPIQPEQTSTQLQSIAARHPRVWVLWWAEQEGDPDGIIPAWLDEHAFEAGSRWFGDVRLERYRLGALPPAQPLQADWHSPEGGEPALMLRSLSVAPTTVGPGDVVALQTEWEASRREPLTFFAQLLDESNQIVGQYDGLGGAPPLGEWEGTQTVRMGVPVAVGTPPGEVRLILGAYRADGQRLLLADGKDALTGAIVQIEAPEPPLPVAAFGVPVADRRDVPIGGARLVGAQSYKVGFDHAPETPLSPGEPVLTVLYWQSQEDGPGLPELTLHLRGQAGESLAQWPWKPTADSYPPREWSAGELVRDAQQHFLPTDLPPGHYRLWLEGEQRVPVGQLVVE